MINFFKKRPPANLPEFWKTYENCFLEKQPEEVNLVRFVVLDTETTGFDYIYDRILSIGALNLTNNHIAINQSFELYLIQDHYNAETAKIHGILKNGRGTECITEIEALKQFLAFVGNAVIIAHHTIFDINMINQALERHQLPKLLNKTLDTSTLYRNTLLTSNVFKKKDHYSLDELAEKFDISMKDRHTAIGDAYITAIAFLKIWTRLKSKGPLKLKDLIKLGS
ncbi:3'-5' exonuclease [Arenibacter sp. 6A1]|uniref:3'-5' exonuclease n=1 Tax=Arenibacter sp. 6A1 TaxID=2720391 RepID=UPI0014486BCA|nr:3'-5' exonuclease [Arenibacter sp. 6A1]NKI27847.1 3'-5' exonuclease [Arenibacter sp. 6A1]